MANNTENNQLMIPYIAHESAMDRLERTNKRMFVGIIILIIAFLLSNAMWLYNWMQYDYVDEFTTVDAGGGIANYIGDDGDITNGTNNEAGENPNEA